MLSVRTKLVVIDMIYYTEALELVVLETIPAVACELEIAGNY